MSAQPTRLYDVLLAKGHALTGDRRLSIDSYRFALRIAASLLEGLTDEDESIRALQLQIFRAQRAKESV